MEMLFKKIGQIAADVFRRYPVLIPVFICTILDRIGWRSRKFRRFTYLGFRKITELALLFRMFLNRC